ncbi:hypothetical protein DYBT9275_01453 [Dyadobacter sp. CECT 9275]|uniref:Peptidase C14 caspase domain-containing protein n=1 Tax=Dyadobacter helix TaxID=2822344 RepID=A0A916NBI6_9BACT|nr:caspase family protein [Dyadobacter sp. CECT 9275]CAG4994725.1 hypothetical protein DYBT9275_01453 [Dyadobacter sp. CECT 9275]
MKNLVSTILFFGVAGSIFFGYRWLRNSGEDVKTEGQTYAVIVGVSDYLRAGRPNQVNNLRYCDDDAHLFYSFLKTPAGGSVPEANIALLIDNKASKANILEQLEKTFAKSGPDDRVIFYFAGHGSTGYFAAYDIDLSDPKTNLLHQDIKEAFRKCRAKTRLCFADACKSGSMKNDVTKQKKELPKKSLEDLESGLVVLMATRSYQNAGENVDIVHGYFTKFLVEGLEGKADKNADQRVTVKETYDYLFRNLTTLPKQGPDDKGQTPVIFGKYDPDMTIAHLKSA